MPSTMSFSTICFMACALRCAKRMCHRMSCDCFCVVVTMHIFTSPAAARLVCSQ
ncbi:hypothetical protein PF001_g31753 [Phytophthora fragariae]|uniref:Secreted protein n=1 Tax=Phytophthora fragariae TaxID=53985 RepID=A0A6A3DBB5_9STRA|nr:hypothetical protein PF009_g32165 [Phytophthora fragariae]KAE9263253.1 hypothetical protein PF001_g31753 [Phytophthora fragariae]